MAFIPLERRQITMATTKDDNRDWLRNIVLGNQPSAPAQTTANIIGGALFGTGLLASLFVEDKSYKSATKNARAQAAAVLPAFEARATAQRQALDADLAGYEQRAVKQAETGLQARGITDKGVARESGANIKAGLSGAYAQARAALSKAKLQAGSQLESAVANYNISVAEKKYESLMNRYKQQMGICSALGSSGTSLLTGGPMGAHAAPMTADTGPQDYRNYIVDPRKEGY